MARKRRRIPCPDSVRLEANEREHENPYTDDGIDGGTDRRAGSLPRLRPDLLDRRWDVATLAGFLETPPSDLTVLQQENGGVFPVSSVYAIIDGSRATGVHGTSDMPAWGMRYSAKAPGALGYYYTEDDADAFVRGRILALVEYISTLQK